MNKAKIMQPICRLLADQENIIFGEMNVNNNGHHQSLALGSLTDVSCGISESRPVALSLSKLSLSHYFWRPWWKLWSNWSNVPLLEKPPPEYYRDDWNVHCAAQVESLLPCTSGRKLLFSKLGCLSFKLTCTLLDFFHFIIALRAVWTQCWGSWNQLHLNSVWYLLKVVGAVFQVLVHGTASANFQTKLRTVCNGRKLLRGEKMDMYCTDHVLMTVSVDVLSVFEWTCVLMCVCVPVSEHWLHLSSTPL